MPSRMSGNVLKTIVPALLVVGFTLRYDATTTVPLTWPECDIVGGGSAPSLERFLCSTTASRPIRPGAQAVRGAGTVDRPSRGILSASGVLPAASWREGRP